MIRVINIHNDVSIGDDEHVVYIGRACGSGLSVNQSVLANPYKIGKDGSRDKVVGRYHQWLRRHYYGGVRAELLRIAQWARDGDVALACWCSPQRCHGDVVKYAVERIMEAGDGR